MKMILKLLSKILRSIVLTIFHKMHPVFDNESQSTEPLMIKLPGAHFKIPVLVLFVTSGPYSMI